MCFNSSDDASGGTTNVTTTNKNFGGKSDKTATPTMAQSRAPTTSSGAPQGLYNSEERMRGQPRIDAINNKNKGGKGGGKDGGKGGGKDGGKGGGKDKGGTKIIDKTKVIDKTKTVAVSPVFSTPSSKATPTTKGGNGSGADSFASGAPDLTNESPLKNNLTLSSRAKQASLRPSLVF